MPTPERKVKDQVKKLLKAHGAYQHWPVQTGYGAACLDCHGCHLGRYFAVETKAPGKKPTTRQSLTQTEIEEACGEVFIVGEKLLYKKGEPMVGKIKLPEGKDPKAPHDIYSGMEELEAWLEHGYK